VQQFLALYTQELERQTEVNSSDGRSTTLFTPDPADERRRNNPNNMVNGDNGQACVP
jgi:hypothetical protein